MSEYSQSITQLADLFHTGWPWGISDLMAERRLAPRKIGEFGYNIKRFVFKMQPKWSEISELLSNFSDGEIHKIKTLSPDVIYLRDYRLLTLDNKLPKPGDAFISVPTGHFLRSPIDSDQFEFWKLNFRRRYNYMDVVRTEDVGHMFKTDRNRPADLHILDPVGYACEILCLLGESRFLSDSR